MKFTSALMVVTPAAKLYQRIVNKYFPGGSPKLEPGMFDMDLLNREFKDEVALLRGENLLALSGHWVSKDADTVHWAGLGKISVDEVWNMTRVVHFSPLKPWMVGNPRASQPNANPHYYEAFELWQAASSQVCH